LHDRTIGQNDLVVHDCVTSKADLVAVEVDASGEKQARNTDRAETTTCGCQVVFSEESINVLPSSTKSAMVFIVEKQYECPTCMRGQPRRWTDRRSIAEW
jgi:hypothetical protein